MEDGAGYAPTEDGADATEPLLEKKASKQAPPAPYIPFGRSGIRNGTFGPESPGVERCAVCTYIVLCIAVLGTMAYTLYTYFGQHRVHVGVESEAQFTAEVPSVMMCPYSKDTQFVTGPTQGAMQAVVTVASYPKDVEGYCLIEREAGAAGEARCASNLTVEGPATAPPCCCYPQTVKSLLGKGNYVCTTHPRESQPCRGGVGGIGGGGRDGTPDRNCFCLDLHRFRLHNVNLQDLGGSGNMMRETFELRSTYNVMDVDPWGGSGDGNNAMKVGLYSNYSAGAKSYFYMEAGFFALGYIEKSIYNYVDWFNRYQYDSYSFQTTMLEETYRRGEDRCKGLPPLARPEYEGMGFNCTKEGCASALAPRGRVLATQSGNGGGGANFCTRFNLAFSEFFIYKGISFSSIYNCWAFLALVMVLATQLNNLNLFNLVFPFRVKKGDERNVSAGLFFLSCCLVRSSHRTPEVDEEDGV